MKMLSYQNTDSHYNKTILWPFYLYNRILIPGLYIKTGRRLPIIFAHAPTAHVCKQMCRSLQWSFCYHFILEKNMSIILKLWVINYTETGTRCGMTQCHMQSQWGLKIVLRLFLSMWEMLWLEMKFKSIYSRVGPFHIQVTWIEMAQICCRKFQIIFQIY